MEPNGNPARDIVTLSIHSNPLPHLFFRRALTGWSRILFAIAVSIVPSFYTIRASEPCRVVLTGPRDVPLAMDWKYQRGQNPGAGQPDLDDSIWPAITPPFRWSALGSYRGEIWMRCRLILAGPRPNQALLAMEKAGDAFEVFLNGSPVGRSGSIQPFVMGADDVQYVPLPSGLWKEENVLAIRLMGTSPLSRMAAPTLLFSDTSPVARTYRIQAGALAAGILCIVTSLLFALRGVITRHTREGLLLAGFLFLLGLLISSRNGMRAEWFESFSVAFVFETGIAILLPPVFIEFLVAWTRSSRDVLLRNLEIGAGALLLCVLALLALPSTFQPIAFQAAFWLAVILPVVFLLAAGRFLKQNAGALKERLRTSGLDHQGPQQEPPNIRNIIQNVQTDFQAHLDGLRTFAKPARKGGNGKASASAHRQPIERWMEDAILLDELLNQPTEPSRSRFSIREELLAAAEEACQHTGERMNRFHFVLPPATERFQSNRPLFRSCVFHLTKNALVHSNGKIEVRAERRGAGLTLRFRDEGPGIAADLQEKVFQPFVRGPGIRFPGSGIGLTLVDRGITALGGRLHFESGHGFFTLIEIDLPEMEEPVL